MLYCWKLSFPLTRNYIYLVWSTQSLYFLTKLYSKLTRNDSFDASLDSFINCSRLLYYLWLQLWLWIASMGTLLNGRVTICWGYLIWNTTILKSLRRVQYRDFSRKILKTVFLFNLKTSHFDRLPMELWQCCSNNLKQSSLCLGDRSRSADCIVYWAYNLII